MEIKQIYKLNQKQIKQKKKKGKNPIHKLNQREIQKEEKFKENSKKTKISKKPINKNLKGTIF